MKKLFTLFFALIASVGIASAQSGSCGDNLKWTYSYGTLTISGTGAMEDYDFLPDVPWYDYRSSIKSVIINDSVTSIGNLAFYGCSSLTSVTIGNSVTSIGKQAFEECTSLTSVTIPNSVTSIGKWAFCECSKLTFITIPNSVTSIGEYAFYYCSKLTSVTIGNSVTSIGLAAFAYCSFLTSINVDSNNPNYSSVDGVLFNKDKTTLVAYPVGKQGAYTIPNSVTIIGDNAFYYCRSLTSVTIPNSVTSIGDDAFRGCSSLTSPVYNAHCFAYMPTSYSGAYAIPEGIKQIAGGAFSYCSSLTSVTIGNSVTSIGLAAFYGCKNITSVTIPNSVTSIGEGAFQGCSSLTSITIPNSVTNIGESAFYGCKNITSVTWNAKNCNSYNFGIQVTSFEFGNEVEVVPSSLCKGMEKLTSITIPNSVTSIGEGAFYNCSSLTSVTIPNSVTSIGYEAFSYCSSLTSVAIGNGVTSIGWRAFYGCSSLTSITIPNSVKSIGKWAFCECSKLTFITIPNSVTSIGDYAFQGCSSLTSVTIPNSVTSIGEYAFYDCKSLTSVHITDLAAWCNIDFGAYSANPLYFAHDLYLNGKLVKDLVIPNSVTTIGSSAFSGCSSLTSVTIPNSVTSIGDYAFYYCTSLTSITCKATTPPTVGSSAFYGVSKSISVHVPCGCVEAYKAANGWKDFTNIQGPLAEYSITVGVNATKMGTAKVDINNACGAQISAKANFGYHFVQWSDGNAENPRTLALTQDTILIAEFAQSFSGQCGDNLYWEFIDGNLYITGNGTMYNYIQNKAPWTLLVSSIKSLSISEGTTTIGNYTFVGCSSLTSITIPNSVTSIGSSAFDGCNNITSVTWNAKNCNSYNFGIQVTSFEFGNEVEVVPSSLCKGMEKLTSITIPNSVKTIGASAFKGCVRLGKVSLGKNLETIGANAFAECTRLYDIYTYATYPPFAEESSFANYNVYVYIPCEYQRDYTLDVVWGKFKFIECISSDNVTTDEIVVTPSENEANVTWPSVTGAATYELVIKDKNGNTVCTLIFNANGQLTSIAFNAPSRNGVPAQTQSAGFSFTITGLDSGTGYDLTLTAKDNSGNIIEETTIPFHTDYPEGIEDVQSDEVQSTKVIKDGQVLILRNGKTYTMQGVEVK